MEEIKKMALATITDIWNCIDWEKVDKRRLLGIWDEFTNKVKASASTTNSYERFVEKLSRKMGVDSLKYPAIKNISNNQSEEEKEKILEVLRENARLIVLQLRLNKETLREENLLKEIKEDK